LNALDWTCVGFVFLRALERSKEFDSVGAHDNHQDLVRPLFQRWVRRRFRGKRDQGTQQDRTRTGVDARLGKAGKGRRLEHALQTANIEIARNGKRVGFWFRSIIDAPLLELPMKLVDPLEPPPRHLSDDSSVDHDRPSVDGQDKLGA
jgi:hypothetical protein